MKTVRYGDIVGTYYQSSKKPSNSLIVIGVGAPNIRDAAELRNAQLLLDAGYDIIVPDYYGFCRSKREFTPINSIQTMLDTKITFTNGTVTEVYSGNTLSVTYSDFVFLGLSYGGSVMPLLPKFDASITKIALFYPVVEYSSFGKCGVQEETVEDFLTALKRGFEEVYRGIDTPVWDLHFKDKLGLCPNKETQYLSNTQLFLAHGTNDVSIYYKKTAEYARKLQTLYPENSIVYKEYTGAEHGLSTMMPATQDLIKWLAKTGDIYT